MHCSQCKNGNSSPLFFLSWESGIGWLIGIGRRYRYCFIYRLQRSFSLFGFRPVVVGVVVPSRRYCVASISCRRRFQTRCAVHLSAIAIFSVATTARRVGRKKKTSKYSAAGALLVSQQKSCKPLAYCRKYLRYFEKERVACLFCCIMVVSSATGK